MHEVSIKAQPTRHMSYGGWEGSNYESGMTMKEIAKRIRTTLKEKYPTTKFSVTVQHYSGGATLHLSVMESDVKMFLPEKELTNYSPNKYYIEKDEILTDEGKQMMAFVTKLVSSYNYDDSDSMSDYYDVNFYSEIRIGKWDKPFIQK